MSKKKTTITKNLLCSLDYIPCAVIINMSFPSKRFTISMVIMALGFDFLLKSKSHKGKNSEKRYKKHFNILLPLLHCFEECLLLKLIILKSVFCREKAHSLDLPLVYTLKTEKL